MSENKFTLTGENTRIGIVLSLWDKRTISEIQRHLKLDRPTLYHHLKILEERGFIERKKDEHKKGKPVTISLKISTKKLLEWIIDYWKEKKEFAEEKYEFFKSELKKERKLKKK